MSTTAQWETRQVQDKTDDLVSSLCDLRNYLRSKKNYEIADKIRDILTKCGVRIGDR